MRISTDRLGLAAATCVLGSMLLALFPSRSRSQAAPAPPSLDAPRAALDFYVPARRRGVFQQFTALMHGGSGAELTITCKTNCDRPVAWSRPVVGEPLGVTQFFNAGDPAVLIVCSAGPSDETVRVVRVTSSGVDLLLERSTKAGPDIRASGGPYPTLTTYPCAVFDGERRPAVEAAWNPKLGSYRQLEASQAVCDRADR